MALQEASSRGRGAVGVEVGVEVVVFEPTMRAAMFAPQLLDKELHQALRETAFTLAFQPIVSVDALEHQGFEVLVRWWHPQRGHLMPHDFIDAAQTADLICELDVHVIDLSLCAMADWQRRGLWRAGWFLSVNLSARHFDRPGLSGLLLERVAQHGMAAQDLHLELTESALMTNLPVAREEMTRLRHAGFEIAMDDFGTGFASLSLLKALPFSSLKIDKSFLDPLICQRHQPSLVATMVQMAQLLGIEVVAEGVETLDQLELLRQLRCAQAQGYLFRAPMASAMAELWLQVALEHNDKS